MHLLRFTRGAVAGFVVATSLSCAQLGIDPAMVEQVLAAAGAQGSQGTGLSENTIAAGLKEALTVGTERTVATSSKPGGFLDNPLVRIALPDELDTMASGLRAVGLSSQVDQLEVSMNRAAETASSEAKAVFWDAVGSMTISDALGILRGPDNAATTYFRGRTENQLRQRFTPVVDSAMEQVGLYQAYDQLLGRYQALSLFKNPTVELNRYVTDETLDGLFTLLAGEEKKIRDDPVARTTDLLKAVFGG